MEEKKEIYSIKVEGIGEIFAEKQIEHHDDPRQPPGTYRMQKTPLKKY